MTMIRVTTADYARPRYGFPLSQWVPLVKLALAYQDAGGGFDWPDGVAPEPPRLLFAKRIAPQLIAEEFDA